MGVAVLATVDAARCADVAGVISRVALPLPKEEVPPLPFSPEHEANFWFFLVAICHQTSPTHGPQLAGSVDRVHRRGWDYLLHAFRIAATSNRTLLTVERWATFDDADCVKLFGTDLTEPKRRAELIRDLADGLQNRGWTSVFEAGAYCGFRITDANREGLLSVLAAFEAFTDPVQKKSVFFLALMSNAGLWTYVDPQALPAPVDYHEMRGHLRIGTVRLDPSLRGRIEGRQTLTVEEDVAVRGAVRRAIEEISGAVESSPNALHYFFWNLFRTYCLRETPDCKGSSVKSFPDVYASAIRPVSGSACPFESFCESANRTSAIDDPIVVTEYY